MSEHDFCRCSLKVARKMAKEAGIKVPAGLTAWLDAPAGRGGYAEVFAKNVNGQVWMGEACCTYEAKGNYIVSLIPEEALALEDEKETTSECSITEEGQDCPIHAHSRCPINGSV